MLQGSFLMGGAYHGPAQGRSQAFQNEGAARGAQG